MKRIIVFTLSITAAIVVYGSSSQAWYCNWWHVGYCGQQKLSPANTLSLDCNRYGDTDGFVYASGSSSWRTTVMMFPGPQGNVQGCGVNSSKTEISGSYARTSWADSDHTGFSYYYREKPKYVACMTCEEP